MKGNEGWHTDSTYMPLAAKAGMLMALVVPPEGGETEFADMRAGYEALNPEMQAKLEGLAAYHSLYHSQAKAGYKHNTDHFYGFHDKGAPLRAVVKTHPETGRKSIYTGRHAFGIVGMREEDSEALLDKLMEDACQPPRTYKHCWEVGDLVVWDNRCVMHRARPYDTKYPRALRASRISGEPEVGTRADVPRPPCRSVQPDHNQRIGTNDSLKRAAMVRGPLARIRAARRGPRNAGEPPAHHRGRAVRAPALPATRLVR